MTVTINIDPYIRPSSTKENALCPARPTMQAAVVAMYGEPPDSEEATLGNNAHGWGQCGIDLLVRDPETCDPLDQVLDIEEGISRLREDMARANAESRIDGWTRYVIEAYVRFVHGLIVKHDIAPENVLVEERLDMAELGFPKGGTSDCLLVIPFKRLIVIDLKAGFLEQDDAADHSQLSVYGVAGAQRFKVPTVDVWVAQPRQAKGQRFTGATFDAQALRETAAWIQAVNARCRTTNPELVPAYDQCKYCRALPHCPAAKDHLMNAQEALAALGAPLDADGYGELADAAKLALKFGEDGKELVKNHMLGGGEATGWKLGAPRATQFVANVPEAMIKLRDAGLEVEAMAAVTLSVTKLPPAALDAIQDHLAEKLSSPPLTQAKRTRAA